MTNWVCLLNAVYFLSCQLLKNWHWACGPILCTPALIWSNQFSCSASLGLSPICTISILTRPSLLSFFSTYAVYDGNIMILLGPSPILHGLRVPKQKQQLIFNLHPVLQPKPYLHAFFHFFSR